MSSEVAPASRASMIAAAWEVEPEASSDEKAEVRLPNGRLSMNGEMSQQVTERPSSARTCVGDVCRLPVPFRANHVPITWRFCSLLRLATRRSRCVVRVP